MEDTHFINAHAVGREGGERVGAAEAQAAIDVVQGDSGGSGLLLIAVEGYRLGVGTVGEGEGENVVIVVLAVFVT